MDLKIENILIRVRAQLNEGQVKLWLPPYYGTNNSSSSEAELQILAESYAKLLNIDVEHCLVALKELQNHALEKMKERDSFKATGVATLKVRVPNQAGGTILSTIRISLTSSGSDLKEAVAQQISSVPSRLKLICHGKVLKDDSSLESQSIKNGMQLMAVVLCENTQNFQNEEKDQKTLETTRNDLNVLLQTNQDHNQYLQVEDQSGNTLSLPIAEKKALVTAMTLHEKGRAALKKEDYSLALIMFLEADNEFNRCNSKILASVDNYALLNLDIAWCYLCLRSVGQIPDAENRLKKCEENFHNSYGANLERLIALKGTSGNEVALFMRLHLLQGIVMFHQNRREEAQNLLERAEKELQSLKVDDASLSALIELGYSPAEARLGLRATQGNVIAAADYITRNREERAESRKKAIENEVLKRARKKLGNCADGKQWIEPSLLNMLVEMGFPKETARQALAQSNNILSQSVQLIHEHPELLEAAMASTSTKQVGITQSLIDQIVAVGFDPRMAKIALKKNNGVIEKAIEELVFTGGVIDGEYSSDEDDDDSNDPLKEARRREAFNRIVEDLSMVDDDHLDLTLIQEEIFLNQYKKLLEQ